MPDNPETTNVTPAEAAQEIVNAGVSSVSSGGRTVNNIPLRDLDDHEDHLKKNAAALNPFGSIVDARAVPGNVRY